MIFVKHNYRKIALYSRKAIAWLLYHMYRFWLYTRNVLIEKYQHPSEIHEDGTNVYKNKSGQIHSVTTGVGGIGFTVTVTLALAEPQELEEVTE